MGFIKEQYSNNYGGLIVSFQGDVSNDNYYAGDSIQAAMQYFNMYVKNNQLFVRSEEELALNEAGINSMAEAEQLRQELNEIISNMTDEEAIERPILFANWKPGISYTVGTRIRYGGRIFKVIQAHTSLEEWTPSRAPSLFAEILTSEDGEPQEWQQPSSTNPYLTGDKVIYEGKVYESLIDNNVWNPIDYPNGWREIIEEPETPETPEEPENIPEWTQPNSTNPYMTGDKVYFEGSKYQSLIDNNIWSPVTYPQGWQLIS